MCIGSRRTCLINKNATCLVKLLKIPAHKSNLLKPDTSQKPMERNSIASELLKCTELPSQLQDLLPSGYSYKLKKWVPHENKPNHFEAVVLTNVYTDDEAQEWWHEFNVKSNTTMRVRATCPKTGKVNTFKIYLRCLHQGRAEKTDKPEFQPKSKSTSPTKRNTNCPAGMIIAIRRHIKYSRSKMRDPVDPVHPCEIQIRFHHNHPTDSADSLRFRPVSKEIEEKLQSLYQIGHSPASALETLKIDLQIEYGSLYSQISSDRYHCPDKSYCYRLYYKHFGKDYASSAKIDVFSQVISKVTHYNSILGETCLNVGMCGSDLAIAICTPLMKRAHSLSQSGDVVYIETCDSPGSKERTEHHVLLLIAHTAVGGVPLGLVLTTSKSTESFTHGFQLLKELLSKHAFGGRGVAGPFTFLAEDSESQRVALNNVWSGSDVVTCSFRILQTMWRWLWDEKHILKDHQLYLLYLIKTVLFASHETEMNNKYQTLCSDAIAVHYPVYLQLVKCLWEKRHLWGLCFHHLSPLQGANNYYEAAVRVFKDKILEATKNFNLVQLLNYLVTRVDLYYRTKLLDILHGKVLHIFRSHYPDTVPPHIVNEIKLVAGNYYLVPSENGDGKVYTVDAELNVCSCPNGIGGVLCLHQFWIFLKMNSEIFKVNFCDEDFRQKLFIVATGAVPILTDSHPQIPVDVPQVVNIECSTQPETNLVTVTETAESIFKETNPLYTESNVTSAANVSISLQESNELVLMPPISNYSQESISSLPDSEQQIPDKTCINSFLDETNKATSNSEEEDISACRSSSLPTTAKEADSVDSLNGTDAEKRMTEVLLKFEHFCQLVRDGLKNQPKDFLPALEIMMKTLERKGYSSDILISGLSFFSVFPAHSLKQKGKKRAPATDVAGEEMVPKVHGRQMITYGKRRLNVQANVTLNHDTLRMSKENNLLDAVITTQTSINS